MASEQSDTNSRVFALRASQWIGCTGAHKHEGKWMPCETHEELLRVSGEAEPKKKTAFVDLHARYNTRKAKGKKKKRGWEKLNESRPLGFTTLEGGGIVSAPINSTIYSGGIKAYIPGVSPRDNDPDVFTNIESARKRSRMLGCIGVRRMPSASGRTVWMPCTTNTDYARRAGTTFLGRRGQAEENRRRQEAERLRRQSQKASEEYNLAPPAAQENQNSTRLNEELYKWREEAKKANTANFCSLPFTSKSASLANTTLQIHQYYVRLGYIFDELSQH